MGVRIKVQKFEAHSEPRFHYTNHCEHFYFLAVMSERSADPGPNLQRMTRADETSSSRVTRKSRHSRESRIGVPASPRRLRTGNGCGDAQDARTGARQTTKRPSEHHEDRVHVRLSRIQPRQRGLFGGRLFPSKALLARYAGS